jgi:hypothetical protein
MPQTLTFVKRFWRLFFWRTQLPANPPSVALGDWSLLLSRDARNLIYISHRIGETY